MPREPRGLPFAADLTPLPREFPIPNSMVGGGSKVGIGVGGQISIQKWDFDSHPLSGIGNWV